jgi:hypothetical protein
MRAQTRPPSERRLAFLDHAWLERCLLVTLVLALLLLANRFGGP